jgi:hypothetical protein
MHNIIKTEWIGFSPKEFTVHNKIQLWLEGNQEKLAWGYEVQNVTMELTCFSIRVSNSMDMTVRLAA